MLKPYEAFGYFNRPVETFFALGQWTDGVMAAPENANRVVLIFSWAAGQPFASTLPPPHPSGGLSIPKEAGPIILTQHEHGSLAQVAWFPVKDLGAAVMVHELILERFPPDADGLTATAPGRSVRRTISEYLRRIYPWRRDLRAIRQP